MSVGRTFWEKATAAHVYSAQGRIRGERYARHWHDLAAIARSNHFEVAVSDRIVAQAVAEHKTYFFSEKDTAGEVIDYASAANGQLRIVPEGAARGALADDYAKMAADEVMIGNALPFEELMQACASITDRANGAGVQQVDGSPLQALCVRRQSDDLPVSNPRHIWFEMVT